MAINTTGPLASSPEPTAGGPARSGIVWKPPVPLLEAGINPDRDGKAWSSSNQDNKDPQR